MNQAHLHSDNMENVRERLENTIEQSSVDTMYDGEDCFITVTQKNYETMNESKWSFCVDFGTGKVQMLEPTEDEESFGNDNEVFEIIKSFLNGGSSREKRRNRPDYDSGEPIKITCRGNKIGSARVIKSVKKNNDISYLSVDVTNTGYYEDGILRIETDDKFSVTAYSGDKKLGTKYFRFTDLYGSDPYTMKIVFEGGIYDDGFVGIDYEEGDISDFWIVGYNKNGKELDRKHFAFSELYEDSVSSSRKPVKSALNLTDVFYDLYNNGYIYEEDENGYNMSYGEYAAISDYMWEKVKEELEQYNDFESAYEAFQDIVNSADDDTKMFWGYSDDDDFYFYADYDNGTYSTSGECPDVLKDRFEEFQQNTALERR